jgi:hypothetical protein
MQFRRQANGRRVFSATTLPEYRSKYIASSRRTRSLLILLLLVQVPEQNPFQYQRERTIIREWSEGSDNEQASGTTVCNDFWQVPSRTEIKEVDTLKSFETKKFANWRIRLPI